MGRAENTKRPQTRSAYLPPKVQCKRALLQTTFYGNFWILFKAVFPPIMNGFDQATGSLNDYNYSNTGFHMHSLDFSDAFNHGDAINEVEKQRFENDEQDKMPSTSNYQESEYNNLADSSIPTVLDFALAFNFDGKNEQNLDKKDMNKPFQCPHAGCGKRFLRNHDLNKHKKLHSGEKPFVCPICQKAFARKDNLSSHVKGHAYHKQHPCDLCDEILPHFASFKEHMEKVHYDDIECGFESQPSPTGSLNDGEQGSSSDASFVCRVGKCNQRFTKQSSFTIHARSHIHRKVFQCQTCSHIFYKSANLTAHMRVHTGERPFHCENCGLMFARKADRDRHFKRQHSPGDLFKCTEEECEASFSRKIDLSRHMKRHRKIDDLLAPLASEPLQDEKEDAHSCETCEETFSTPDELKEHILTHQKTFECKHCDEVFQTKPELRKHLFVHEPPTCHICNRVFAQPPNLRVHMKIHTGEKPYHCESCGLMFSRKGDKDRHVKRQHVLKPSRYRCPEEGCGLGFSKKKDVAKHMITHEENYMRCKVCFLQFNSAVSLKQHVETDHQSEFSVNDIYCILCGKVFVTNEARDKHLLEHTGGMSKKEEEEEPS